MNPRPPAAAPGPASTRPADSRARALLASVESGLLRSPHRPCPRCFSPAVEQQALEDQDGKSAAVVVVELAMAWEPSEFKKDVTGEMPNAYDPKSVEGCWGEFWEKEGLMGADAEVRLSADCQLGGACFASPCVPADRRLCHVADGAKRHQQHREVCDGDPAAQRDRLPSSGPRSHHVPLEKVYSI